MFGPENSYNRLPPEEPGHEQAYIAVKGLFLESIEQTLGCTGEWNIYPEEALKQRLDYAAALTEIGEPDRADNQFAQALAKIERGSVFFSRQVLPGESELLGAQATFYALAAAKLYTAGFLELADRTATRAEATLQAALRAENADSLRLSPQLAVALRVAERLALAGYNQAAGSIQHNTACNMTNYAKHLQVLEIIEAHYGQLGQEDEVANIQQRRQQIIDEMYDHYTIRSVANGSDVSQLGAVQEIEKLIRTAKRYKLALNASTTLASSLKIAHGSPDIRVRIPQYALLATAYFNAGEEEKCSDILSTALIELRSESAVSPYIDSDGTLIERVATCYAQLGDTEHLEILLEAVPSDHNLEIRVEQIEKLMEDGPSEIVLKQLGLATAMLPERLMFRDDNEMDELDFVAGLEIAIAYKDIGDYASMDRVYRMLEDCNAALLACGNGPFNRSIAAGYLSHGDVSRAFEVIKRAQVFDQVGWLIDLLVTNFGEAGVFAQAALPDQHILTQELHNFISYRGIISK